MRFQHYNSTPLNFNSEMTEQPIGNDDLIRRVQCETNVEILPGTELMADIGGAHFIHAHNSANSAVLVPQPTEDPHDPLVRRLSFVLGNR